MNHSSNSNDHGLLSTIGARIVCNVWRLAVESSIDTPVAGLTRLTI